MEILNWIDQHSGTALGIGIFIVLILETIIKGTRNVFTLHIKGNTKDKNKVVDKTDKEEN